MNFFDHIWILLNGKAMTLLGTPVVRESNSLPLAVKEVGIEKLASARQDVRL